MTPPMLPDHAFMDKAKIARFDELFQFGMNHLVDVRKTRRGNRYFAARPKLLRPCDRRASGSHHHDGLRRRRRAAHRRRLAPSDPKVQPIERVREIRDLVCRNASDRATRLRAEYSQLIPKFL